MSKARLAPLVRRSDEDEALIYCGPDIGRVLKQYSVFIGPLPADAMEIIKKHPCVKKLLVPASQYHKVSTLVQTQGTIENYWFNRVFEEMGE